MPHLKIATLTEVEVTFVAFDLVHSSAVKQLKAVKGVVLQPARTDPSLQQVSPWDTHAGAGRQSSRLSSFLKPSHG